MHRLDASAAEHSALRFSTAGAFVMAAVGLLFAGLSRSEAVLLDGIYSLVAFVMAFWAARIAQAVEEPSTPSFQFGKAAFEPLINTIRGTVVLIVLVFAFVGSVSDLLGGGRPIGAGVALVYSVSAGVVCLFVSARQRRVARGTSSSILEVDAATWLVDGVISLTVGLAFVLILVLDLVGLDEPQAYVDPLVVVAMVLFLLREPVLTIRDNVGELLQVAPSRRVNEKVDEVVLRRSVELPCSERQVKLWRLGRYLYVRVTFLLEPWVQRLEVEEMDRIRRNIYDEIRNEAMVVKVDCMFTREHKWLGRAWEAAHPDLESGGGEYRTTDLLAAGAPNGEAEHGPHEPSLRHPRQPDRPT